VDSSGATLDFLLSARQDAAAAKRFLAKALGRQNHPVPRVINTDGHSAYPPAIVRLKAEGALDENCRQRPVPYLNNVLEQDHRATLPFPWLGVRGITAVMFSRDQLKRAASLTDEDFVELGKCRRPHNRLGFAYQVAFVRLFDRFPQQQPFELFEELVCFSAAQLGLDAELIELYLPQTAADDLRASTDRRWLSETPPI
jgi:hypothetical protein